MGRVLASQPTLVATDFGRPLGTGLPSARPSWGTTPKSNQGLLDVSLRAGSGPGTLALRPTSRPAAMTSHLPLALALSSNPMRAPATVRTAWSDVAGAQVVGAVDGLGEVGEGRVSAEESALLDRHVPLLRKLGFCRIGSKWETEGGSGVQTKEVFWFLKGHLAVSPEDAVKEEVEELSDEAMFDAFASEMAGTEFQGGVHHVVECPGREEVREEVRNQAMQSVRPSTRAAYEKGLSLWKAAYDSTAPILGLVSGDYYLKRLSDDELRGLVVGRFLIQLYREGKRKAELGRFLAAIRYYFTCEGQSTAVFSSELVTRVRDSCSYNAAETRVVIARRMRQGTKLAVPACFLSDLYVNFRDIIGDPAAVSARAERNGQGDSRILVGSAEYLQMSATCLFLMLICGVRPSNVTKPERKSASELRMLVQDIVLVGNVKGVRGSVGLAFDSGKELVPVESLEHAMILVVDSKTGPNPSATWKPVEPGTPFGKMLAVMLWVFSCNANLLSEDKLFTRRSINGGRCAPAVRNEDGTYTLPANQGTMCELLRRGPRSLLSELAVQNGLPPGSFSMKCGRVTYATVSEIRRDLASGTLTPSVLIECGESDDEDEEVGGEPVFPAVPPAIRAQAVVPLLDPLGNWSTKSRTQTTTYSQAGRLGSGAGGFMEGGHLNKKGVEAMLVPTLSLVPSGLSVLSDITGGFGGSQTSAVGQVSWSACPGSISSGLGAWDCESVVTGGDLPQWTAGIPLETTVGDWGHELDTILAQFVGVPGDENFEAAVACGLDGYQPYHGDAARGGRPRLRGLDQVHEYHCGVHASGEGCVPCNLARLSECDLYDTGEERLVAAAECAVPDEYRGVGVLTINQVPFSNVGFLHHRSCACAGLPFDVEARRDMCDQAMLCMAVAAKASIIALCRMHASSCFIWSSYRDWRLPHVPTLRHLNDRWTLEELFRRETARAEDRAIVVKSDADWVSLRSPWLVARSLALKKEASAFVKGRRVAVETERVLQLNTEAEEIRLLGQLAFQRRVAGVGSAGEVAQVALTVAHSAARTMAYVKPVAVKAATSEEQLEVQKSAEAYRVATAAGVQEATMGRVLALRAAIVELNDTLGVGGTEATTTASSVTVSAPATSGGTSSNVQGDGSPTITGTSAALASDVSDNSQGSSEASIEVSYWGIIPRGVPRLSHPPGRFADEQAADSHGGLKRGLPGFKRTGCHKKGKGGPVQDAESTKDEEDDNNKG